MTERANDNEGPFSIGQDVWPGLAKLAEECGEVIQIIAKLIATGGRTDHWSGLDLRVELENEMADVRAALSFVAAHNPDLDVDRINGRVIRKTELFLSWHGHEKWLTQDKSAADNEGPVDRVPSHSSRDPYIFVYIDRNPYRVSRGIRTGLEIRAFATPPIKNDRDLWLQRPGDDDLLVLDHMGVDLANGGLRFWTAPTHINAGSSIGDDDHG